MRTPHPRRSNGRRAAKLKQELADGDELTVTDQPTRARPSQTGAHLRIIYEDDDLLVVDKPTGLLTSTNERERRPTLLAMVREHVGRDRQARIGLRRARRAAFACLPLVDRPGADPALEAILDRDEIGRLLRRLTERQRAMVVAHYYLGQTHDEIAAALGISRGTVSATLSQSLARMREALRVV